MRTSTGVPAQAPDHRRNQTGNCINWPLPNE